MESKESTVTIPALQQMKRDGRVRMAHAAIGYAASAIDKPGSYANVAKITLDAFTALGADVRAARQIKY